MKKGFTLVELMAVIIILSIISLIVFPTMVQTISNAKENLYNNQVEAIEKAAKDWSIKNTEKLPSENSMCYVSLVTLMQAGLVENKTIKNPNTDEDMNGKVVFAYDKSYQQYVIKYIDTSDANNEGLITDAVVCEKINNDLPENSSVCASAIAIPSDINECQ